MSEGEDGIRRTSMPDRLDFLSWLDGLASRLRGLGLEAATRWGREASRFVLGNSLCVEWDGLTLTGAIEHRGYLMSLRHGRREPGTLALVRRLIPSGGVVVDVGAYIGVYTCLSARLIGGNGKVYAFEPDPRNCAVLRRNTTRNGFGNIVEIVEAAASDVAGQVRFFLNNGDASASSLARRYPGAREVFVPSVQLDQFLADVPSVDFMKIDAEGAEVKILRGAESLIRRSSDLWLVCEVNPSALIAAGTDPVELLGMLDDMGFFAYLIEEETPKLRYIPENLPPVKYMNILAHRGCADEARSLAETLGYPTSQ